MERLDGLNLNLFGCSGQSFNFSRMLHNSCVQGLIQQLRQSSLNNHPPPYTNKLILLETQKHESQQLLNEFEERNLY
jgi:hypothetical protein